MDHGQVNRSWKYIDLSKHMYWFTFYLLPPCKWYLYEYEGIWILCIPDAILKRQFSQIFIYFCLQMRTCEETSWFINLSLVFRLNVQMSLREGGKIALKHKKVFVLILAFWPTKTCSIIGSKKCWFFFFICLWHFASVVFNFAWKWCR